MLSIPLAKLMKGKSLLKPAAKTVAKTLPKVSGMPDWFPSLVAKIEKEGRLATEGTGLGDNLKIKELTIPSKTGKGGDEIFTKIEYPDGRIEIQANVEGGAYGQPFELHYTPPKADMDVTTGKPIKEPGDFSIIEQRPKPDPNDPGNYEFDWEAVSKDEALSNLEKVEKITTGKVKNLTEAEKRAAQRKNYSDSPYDDISNRYPEPDIDYDYADGGIASFVNGGKAKKKSKAEEPLSKYKSYSEEELLGNIEAKSPNQLQSFSLEDYQLNTMPMFEPKDVAPPKSYSPMPVEEFLRRREYVDLADGGLTKTVPPAKGPDSQGVETLFRRRYS